MKKLFALLVVVIVLFSCDNTVKKKSTPIKDIPLSERAIPNLPGAATSNTVIGGPHYICPKNCVGGNGAAAGKCPVCESEMAHNQGFHVGPNSTTTPQSNNITNPANSNGPNANGQYHYTCPKGCAGGSGSSGNCNTCSTTLAHNQAYHN